MAAPTAPALQARSRTGITGRKTQNELRTAQQVKLLSITKFNFLVPLGIFKHILFIAIFSFRSRPLVFSEPYLWQKDTIGHLTAKQTR